MISQFFILSSRGDTIISRHFRRDVPRDSAATFFRKVKLWDGKSSEAPPVFFYDGVSYLYIVQQGLYFLFTTKGNVSSALFTQLLVRLTEILKDYCGVLSEESIRKNFILIYEILDEVIDFGYPQNSSTERIRAFIFNKPAELGKRNILKGLKIGEFDPKTTPSTSANKSVLKEKNDRNEIFVDIIERISITFSAEGYVTYSHIDGAVQMKSYLSGNPNLHLALNEDLVIGASDSNQFGRVVLDDCNFHSSAQLDDFERNRVIFMTPPDGEFVLMNYRISNAFRPPFKVELCIRLRADIPAENYASSVEITVPVPKSAVSASFSWEHDAEFPPGLSSEFIPQSKRIVCKVKKFPGCKDIVVRCKVNLQNPHTPATRKQIGPLNMSFEIPMYNVSNLQVRYLRIVDSGPKYKPYRWVRYVTKSSSYMCRLK